MFIAQAHSFKNQARLAITLAWVAGYTNVITILTCGTATSHVSGIASNLGRDVAEQSWGLAAFAVSLLGAFYFGAVVSGFCTELGRRRAWEAIYILPIIVETALLLVFALGVELHPGGPEAASAARFWMSCVAAASMGLQNATITRISSGVVRTTHVTGVLTDLGLESAQFGFWIWDRRLRRAHRSFPGLLRSIFNHPTHERLLLLASIFGSFAFGAGLGTFMHGAVPRAAMLPPVLFLVWIILQDHLSPIAEIGESDALTASAGADMPSSLAIYHLRKDQSRLQTRHRMPNLLAWVERLPEKTRVVILDLGHNARLDKNAALDLRAAILKMKSHGRRLILAGLDQAEYEQLRAVAGGDLAASDVCADIDMAFLHAMMIVAETPRPAAAK